MDIFSCATRLIIRSISSTYSGTRDIYWQKQALVSISDLRFHVSFFRVIATWQCEWPACGVCWLGCLCWLFGDSWMWENPFGPCDVCSLCRGTPSPIHGIWLFTIISWRRNSHNLFVLLLYFSELLISLDKMQNAISNIIFKIHLYKIRSVQIQDMTERHIWDGWTDSSITSLWVVLKMFVLWKCVIDRQTDTSKFFSLRRRYNNTAVDEKWLGECYPDSASFDVRIR